MVMFGTCWRRFFKGEQCVGYHYCMEITPLPRIYGVHRVVNAQLVNFLQVTFLGGGLGFFICRSTPVLEIKETFSLWRYIFLK